MTKHSVPAVRLNHHLEINQRPVNSNPSKANSGFDPGNIRRVKLNNIEDLDSEESQDECDSTGDCQE